LLASQVAPVDHTFSRSSLFRGDFLIRLAAKAQRMRREGAIIAKNNSVEPTLLLLNRNILLSDSEARGHRDDVSCDRTLIRSSCLRGVFPIPKGGRCAGPARPAQICKIAPSTPPGFGLVLGEEQHAAPT
jgi:hypothetical protein